MKPILCLKVAAATCLLTACQVASFPTQPPEPTVTTVPTPTESPVPSETLPATPTVVEATGTATFTPEPSATATSQPLSGQAFSAVNAASAQATELLLSGYPAGLFWPGNTSVLVFANNSFLEIYLDPLATGITTPVQAPGTILGIAPDGSSLIYQGGDGGLFLWQRSGQPTQSIPYGGAAYFATYSPDGKTVAIGAVDSWKVTLYDRETMEPFQTLTGFETAAPVYSAIAGPKRSVLAWYARGKLQFQDIASQGLGGEMGFQDFIQGFAFDPEGDKAAVIAGGLLQIINTAVSGGTEAQDLLISSPEVPITIVVFSPDSALVAAGVSGDIVIWDTTNWSQVAVLNHGSQFIRQLSFSPDGRALVSVDDQQLLKSWRIP